MLRVPLEWLKEFVPIRMTPDRLAHRLTMAGFEVTAVDEASGEPVFSLEVTPNRADCLSIIGLAREVAAITGQKLKLPRVVQGSRLKVHGRRPRTPNLEPRTPLRIRIEDRKSCWRYVGRLIEGVRIGPSPAWIRDRLAACGLRPINNVVDITNYVLLELGQPLHAFDFSALRGEAVVVRRARAGETLITIDGEARALAPEMLVIADAARPVAVAGVMGGRDAQVTEATTRILLESAWFDPVTVRRTSRRLGLASESSYRFERGVDLGGVEPASQRAASLILELAGGRQAAAVSVGRRAPSATVVTLEPSRIARWLGPGADARRGAPALARLGFAVRKHRAAWRVTVPSYRRDVQQDVDLVEEIARLVGYDTLPETAPQAAVDRSPQPERYAQALGLRHLLAGSGLTEAITWSLVSEADLERARWGAEAGKPLRLRNPLSRDHLLLRPTLLIGLLRAVANNYAQGAAGVRLFEVGHVFIPVNAPEPSPKETLYAGVVLSGLWEQHWQGKREAELFRLKGIIEQTAARAAGQPLSVEPAPVRWAEPGTGMRLLLADTPLGELGQVSRQVCDGFDIDKAVWFAELTVDVLLPAQRRLVQVRPLSLFPSVKRDLSFLVDKRVSYAQVAGLIRETGGPLAQQLELIDRYDGAQVPKTQHSLTVSIEYRDPSRTLTSEEADALHHRIGEALIQRFGAQLR